MNRDKGLDYKLLKWAKKEVKRKDLERLKSIVEIERLKKRIRL